MSAGATGAGGATYHIANTNAHLGAPYRERLAKVQAEMDWLAAGNPPLMRHCSRAATVEEVKAYMASRPRRALAA